MKKGRRKKVRYVQGMPVISQFSPRGRAGRPEEVELKVDEFEAIKLADYQGCDQAEGAEKMGVSRPTFGRILRQGRKVLADAVVNGKIIRIRIGDVQVGVMRSRKRMDNMEYFAKKEASIREKILKHTLKTKINQE